MNERAKNTSPLWMPPLNVRYRFHVDVSTQADIMNPWRKERRFDEAKNLHLCRNPGKRMHQVTSLCKYLGMFARLSKLQCTYLDDLVLLRLDRSPSSLIRFGCSVPIMVTLCAGRSVNSVWSNNPVLSVSLDYCLCCFLIDGWRCLLGSPDRIFIVGACSPRPT